MAEITSPRFNTPFSVQATVHDCAHFLGRISEIAAAVSFAAATVFYGLALMTGSGTLFFDLALGSYVKSFSGYAVLASGLSLVGLGVRLLANNVLAMTQPSNSLTPALDPSLCSLVNGS